MENDPTKIKILIVDDDKFLVDMYSLKFSESGYEVETAQSGDEAVKKLEAGVKPDIYLVDVVMPVMDGFELVENIKQKFDGNRGLIVILSNLGQKEDVEKGLGLGADGYIVKASATPTEVVNKVKEILANRKYA
ncbi:MAG TPA: response regulator [Candidatus Paceibacterota bacterium]|jgi:two-component system, OmpR family, alkaline phosphatase synthesis response regulator PhoP|nr:response regulator [Candidatus Paceibacterota bacterium]HOH11453.1 response regulator [Candidatus Paceibacterota bacterium]HOY11006.1 response regulator [Candidatus Paceibacterota bacterium]HPI24688.1 response regulator [Candidatus Paceibacterota bacterium]HPN89377.1 response regulator [Candidatus Paceibacterota bacterium]